MTEEKQRFIEVSCYDCSLRHNMVDKKVSVKVPIECFTDGKLNSAGDRYLAEKHMLNITMVI